MKTRTFSTVVLVGAVALMVALKNVTGLYVIGLILCLGALWEFYKMAEHKGVAPFKKTAMVFAALMMIVIYPGFHYQWVQYGYVTLNDKITGLNANFFNFEQVLPALFIISVLGFAALKPTKNNPLARVAVTVFGFLYIPFLFSFLLRLVPLPNGLLLATYVVVVTKCTDIGAYLVGSCLGKHQMSPQSSPKKTWEGCAGGVLLALTVSLGFAYFLTPELWWRHALILGVLLPPLSVVGDLIESVIKRDTGAKDSGAVIPGIGGALDLVDSMLFTAPVFYFYLVLIRL
ncbi:MAG: phosphatidate cytidylyltransferase [Verrucomicrobiales bacterium]|jgi:phosphatidate cytidylyltransferase|nr:phosphatidate cytidylyltransferase [Verrucomicrobiales bacterium]